MGYESIVDELKQHAGDLSFAVIGDPDLGSHGWFSPDPSAAFPNKAAIASFFGNKRSEYEVLYQEAVTEPVPYEKDQIYNPEVAKRTGMVALYKHKIDFLMSIQKAYAGRRKTRLQAMHNTVNLGAYHSKVLMKRIYLKRMEALEKRSSVVVPVTDDPSSEEIKKISGIIEDIET